MKKYVKSILAVLLACTLVTELTSCHDDIYGLIDKETKLDTRGMKGDTSQIVQYGDYLFIANGNLYYKSNQQSYYLNIKNPNYGYKRNWKAINAPTNKKGDYNVPASTFYIASDNEWLYALTFTWEEDDEGANSVGSAEIYATNDKDLSDGLTWKKVDVSSIVSSTSYLQEMLVFDNQARTVSENPDLSLTFDFSNRKAYARLKNKNTKSIAVYKLNGTGAPTALTDEVFLGDSKTSNSMKAAYFNGKTYMSKYYALCATEYALYYAESYTTGKRHYIDGSSTIYTLLPNGKIDHHGMDNGAVLSISAGSDFLLTGTTNGIDRVRLDPATKIATRSAKFDSNGGSISSEYVFMTYILNPNKKQDSVSVTEGTDEYCSTTIYGSIGSSSDSWSDVGLYSFFPARKEWNRDGD